MKKAFIALMWAILFACLGGVVMAGLTLGVAAHHPAPKLLLFMAGLGVMSGLDVFVMGLCFAWLPGVRPELGAVRRFGLTQGLWGIFGMLLAMASGAGLLAMLRLDINFLRILAHGSGIPDISKPGYLVSTVLAGELTAALWIAWYLRFLGPRYATDGSPRGVAWRPAPRLAYGAAALAALALLALVGAVYHLVPPDLSKLQNMQMAKLFSGPPVTMAAMLVVTFFIAPVIEEVAFRGIAFGGIAAELGSGWAVCITTLLFTAIHAPEKIYYPPGFLDVALLALISCWLRLRYGSIKPGILLHVTYNTGLMLIGPLL
jgi:membrane protease YdiL (CAAX protease family)